MDAATVPDAAQGLDAGPPVDPLVGIGVVEQVAGGFGFTEGPQWDPASGVLYFSDIPNNRIHKVTGTTVTVFREPTGKANGLALDTAGRLMAAEHFNRRVSITDVDGGVAAVVERYQGQRFNSPNDLIMRSDGTLYFTDPPYGLEGAREVSFNGVYRLTPGGVLTAEDQGNANTTRPNGVVLSLDETTLYVADTAQSRVFAWDVAGDGALSNKRVFVMTMGGGDGMALDARGNLYVTTSAGVEVFAPSGTRWGIITVAQEPANCAFGDADARTLYITARTALYKVRLVAPGVY